uniref:Putative endosomal membrane protein emp70 n=1 Tax=Ixodes ricinus TaxID=34613 RepID=A0A0K8RJC3_IXORI
MCICVIIPVFSAHGERRTRSPGTTVTATLDAAHSFRVVEYDLAQSSRNSVNKRDVLLDESCCKLAMMPTRFRSKYTVPQFNETVLQVAFDQRLSYMRELTRFTSFHVFKEKE